MTRNRILSVLIALGAALLTGCGKVRSADALYKEAMRNHGKCTVVSKSSDEKQTVVILHDELQDFDYKVSSVLIDISIDGASLGKSQHTSDHFTSALIQKALTDNADEISNICSRNGVTCDVSDIKADDAESAEKAAVSLAGLLQKYNLESRLDGYIIDADKPDYSIHYGSVRLPDVKWRSAEDELEDYYTEMARMQTDPKAEFIRKEKKTFRDTGAELDRVVHVLGEDIPESPDSPVTFYYFRASDGSEYYLCDFNYYDENHSRMAWFTNYRQEK